MTEDVAPLHVPSHNCMNMAGVLEGSAVVRPGLLLVERWKTVIPPEVLPVVSSRPLTVNKRCGWSLV